MTPIEREQTAQKISDLVNLQPNEASKNRLLMVWRARLEGEPLRLQSHEVDKIVREVRRRLNPVSR